MINAPANYDTQNALDAKCTVHYVSITPMTNMLVGAWELDEASGQRADYTGRNEFTPVNTPGTAAGKTQATALQLTAASSQYLRRSVYDNSCLIINDESVMFTGWIYLDSKGADRYIVSQWSDAAAADQSWYLRFHDSSDRLQWVVRYTDGTTATLTASTLGSPATATWYYVVFWYDKTAGTLNISINNGTTDSTSTSGKTVQTSTADLRIGAVYIGGVGGYWNGRIEQLTMWRRILTTGERGALYAGGTGAPFTVLTDYSPFLFSTSSNSASENNGTALLQLEELSYQSFIEKSESPLARLTFSISDGAGVISALVATGIIGYKVRLYAGFYNLALADFTQIFGGRISEITEDGPRFRFACTSYLSFAQEKIIFNSAATTLLDAVNSTDVTFRVQDASQFSKAQSTPQSFRQLIVVDTEMCEYRGKAQASDGTWNLANVVRSAELGYPLPPFYGGPAVHGLNRLLRHLPKAGNIVPETSQVAQPWMHPMRLAQDILNNVGNQGLGESIISLNPTSWTNAETALGPTLQFRYIFSEGINGKRLLESICRDVGGYLIQFGDGSLGIKLYPFASTLHAAWDFEESSGNRADTIHANRSRNYDLTPSGSPGSTTGKIGSAIQLTAASSQYVWRAYGGLQPASADFSIAVWVYIDSKGADRAIMSQWDNALGTDEAWRLWYSGGADRFTFTIYDGNLAVNLNADALGSPSTGTWYLITASFNRSTLEMRLSVNNGTVNTATANGYPTPTTEEFRIGAIGNGLGTMNYWDGRIDSAAVWFDHILTAAEITSLHNGGSGISFSTFLSTYPAFTPSSVDTIQDANIVERPRWLRNGELAINRVIYHYDYVPTQNEYAALFEYKDNSLIDAIGKQLTLEIFSKGIRSRLFEDGPFCWFDSTDRFLMSRAEAYIQRFGREAPVIGATSLYDKHLIEIGDDATVTFDQVVNLTTGVRSLNNADVEVSAIRHRYQANLLDFEFAKYA